MSVLIKSFLSSILLIVAMDFVWLGFVMNRFNTEQLKDIGRISDGKFDVWMPPAILTYILMATVVAVFILPLTKDLSSISAIALGALMGLCVYGIFDLTNLAILKGYPIPFALADMAWGTVLFAVVTGVVKKICC